MAQRLPFGEVSPGAKPLGAFVSPAQIQTAGAARPALLDSPSGVVQLQQGSGGSVQGYNQFQQVATALAPFSKTLLSLTETGIVSYVSGQIESGYYDELKNQSAKAALGMQLQQEQGAINAATTVSQLQKRDPVAAQLLQDSNPWKLIGRRRAAAQLAGQSIDNALSSDLINNQGQLAAMQPGSPALMQRKAQITQEVMSKYGLTGDELEAQFYTVPKLNQAWDKYSEKQQTLYAQTVKQNTIDMGVASMGALLQGYAQNGIPFNGEIIRLGDPRFAQLGGLLMTAELDRTLSMVGGTDRSEAVKALQTQLYGTYGQVPGLRDVLTFVQGGNPGDKSRPTWGASNPLGAVELTNRGNDARLKAYENEQQGIENELDGLWNQAGMPGSMLPTDPAYAGALLEFRNQAAAKGYRDLDGYMGGKMKDRSTFAAEAYAADPIQEDILRDQINDLTITELRSPGAVQALREQVRSIAAGQPTRQLQEAKLKELRGLLDEKVKQAEAFTPGIQKGIDSAVQQDLKAGPVAKLLAKKGEQSAFLAAIQGGQSAAGAAGAADARAGAFASRVEDLYVRAFETKLGEWQAKNPGQPLTPATKNVLLNQAVTEVRKGQEYKDAYKQATGLNPGEVGAKKVGAAEVGTEPSEKVRGVPKSAAGQLSDTAAQRFRVQPVMEGQWLREELVNVGKGKPVSAELYRLANRAKTSTNKFLLEQLRFYPQLDPRGGIRQYLQKEVEKQRQGQQVSSANYQAVIGQAPFNPMAPGSWLMNMLTPPAAAATLPPSYQRFADEKPGRVSTIAGDKGGLAATVSAGEGGWNSVNYGTTGSASQMRLTSMTIKQVEALQSKGKVFAVGAYQFTPGVLARARRDAGLTGNEVMTPDVQTKLFWGLALGGKRERLAAYLRGESNDLTGAHQDLSMEWAGVAGPNGRGYYDGDKAGNRASVGAARVRQALIAARKQLSGR